ncbi:hypothetical protein pb186bvf_010732 [Paramecium bursaria]
MQQEQSYSEIRSQLDDDQNIEVQKIERNQPKTFTNVIQSHVLERRTINDIPDLSEFGQNDEGIPHKRDSQFSRNEQEIQKDPLLQDVPQQQNQPDESLISQNNHLSDKAENQHRNEITQPQNQTQNNNFSMDDEQRQTQIQLQSSSKSIDKNDVVLSQPEIPNNYQMEMQPPRSQIDLNQNHQQPLPLALTESQLNRNRVHLLPPVQQHQQHQIPIQQPPYQIQPPYQVQPIESQQPYHNQPPQQHSGYYQQPIIYTQIPQNYVAPINENDNSKRQENKKNSKKVEHKQKSKENSTAVMIAANLAGNVGQLCCFGLFSESDSCCNWMCDGLIYCITWPYRLIAFLFSQLWNCCLEGFCNNTCPDCADDCFHACTLCHSNLERGYRNCKGFINGTCVALCGFCNFNICHCMNRFCHCKPDCTKCSSCESFYHYFLDTTCSYIWDFLSNCCIKFADLLQQCCDKFFTFLGDCCDDCLNLISRCFDGLGDCCGTVSECCTKVCSVVTEIYNKLCDDTNQNNQ